jgi:hypothetical protein
MSKPERGSLSMMKRPLPNLPPATAPKELENRLLTGSEPEQPLEGSAGAGTGAAAALDSQPYAQPASQQVDVQPDVQHGTRLTPRPGKRKEPVQMVTYRIPASLYDRLFRTAEYNNLNMTDIVVEAIDRHLPNFPQPE